jgi:diguanylate cyclase (GGDEF)-like protein
MTSGAASQDCAAPSVLVVDDDAALCDGLTVLLESEGYAVTAACDGEEALKSVRTHAPSLIVLDLALPTRTGFSVLRALRAGASTADIPVMILSAFDRRNNRILGLDLGADDFVSKPIDSEEFLARVRRHVQRGTARRALFSRSVQDPLTNVLNRRGITDFLSEALVGCGQAPLSVLMIDLNDFKRINDVYGHASGDQILCEVASLLRQIVRSSDRVGRLGGDEFLLVLPGLGASELEVVKQRLREGLPVSIELPTTVRVECQCAIGAATTPDATHHDERCDQLLHRVDIAMYADKRRRGRKPRRTRKRRLVSSRPRA